MTDQHDNDRMAEWRQTTYHGVQMDGRTVTERDRLIEEFSREYPEISGPEMQQAEINKDAAENWDSAVYPPYEGPGYTEPPADWEGWHQPHSEHEREHYWDTPEHQIPPEPQPAGYEPIPEAEPF